MAKPLRKEVKDPFVAIQQTKALMNERSKDDMELTLPLIHHVLMKEYGWIPFEEFKKLPISVVFGLLNEIRNWHEMEKKEMERASKS